MRYKQLLLEVRFANQDKIDEIITQYRLDPIKDKIMKLLKKEKEYFKRPRIQDIKTDWDIKDTESRTFVHFGIEDFRSLLNHIGDWLRDSNQYDRARGAQSLTQLYRMADQYFAEKNRKASEEEDWAGVETVYEFDNGFKWVKLKSNHALNREGKLMSHCVGSYCNRVEYDSYMVFSLRDKKNIPHVTMGFDVYDNERLQLEQIQGKGNTIPDQKYIPYIKKFLENNPDIHIFDKLVDNLGLIELNNEIYDVNNLPDGLWIDHDLILTTKHLYKLPKNMYVNGTLSIFNSQVTELPENLSVTKDIYTIRTPLMKINSGLRVGRNLDLDWTQIDITSFPKDMNFRIGNDLHCYYTPLAQTLKQIDADNVGREFRYLFRNLQKQVDGKIIY